MPVEPPVVSPHDLDAAYAALAVDDGEAATAPPAADGEPRVVVRPIAGGTDVMVALTGEIGRPPDRLVDLWASMPSAGSPSMPT